MIQIISVLTLSELQHGEDSSPPQRNGVGGATDASGGGDPVATLVRHAAAFFFVSQHDGDGCASGAPVPTPTVSAGQSAASCVSPLSRRGEAGSSPPLNGDGGATDVSGGGDPVATPVRDELPSFLLSRPRLSWQDLLPRPSWEDSRPSPLRHHESEMAAACPSKMGMGVFLVFSISALLTQHSSLVVRKRDIFLI
jgi:hypothetical protein